MHQHPEIFPSGAGITELVRRTHQVTLDYGALRKRIDLVPLQMQWVEKCEDKSFLENMSKGCFNGTDTIVKATIEKKFKKIITGVLEKNPTVFPSSPQIVELLENTYQVTLDAATIRKNTNSVSLQIDWIEGCEDKAFLEHMGKGCFGPVDDTVKAAIKKRFGKIVTGVLEKNPEVVPNSNQIAGLLERTHNIKPADITIRKNIDLVPLQMRWIEECEDKALLENMTERHWNGADKKITNAITNRFGKIVTELLEKNPEVFPGSNQIAGLLESAYGVKPRSCKLGENIDLISLQTGWVEKCEDNAFLENMRGGRFIAADSIVKVAIEKRVEKIVTELLKANPAGFPSGSGIAELVKRAHQVTLDVSTMGEHTDLVPLQMRWVEECEEKVFLENVNRGSFNGVDKKVKSATTVRLGKILTEVLEKNPEVFPSSPQIAELVEKIHQVKIDPQTVGRYADTTPLQIGWIGRCDEKLFLENLTTKGRFTRVKRDVKNAIEDRVHRVLIAHEHELDKLPLARTTIKKYLQKFPDVAFLATINQEHRFTVDQRLVLSMQIWRAARSEELHAKIGERVEQLWGFRELVALLKDGRCLTADVISMFHESMPEKAKGIVPESEIRHFFVDDLKGGKYRTEEGKEVLLLSFMHWLSDGQTAEILFRLNRAVGMENGITMTISERVGYDPEILVTLERFGFAPVGAGSLYLIPPEDVEKKEGRKLLTRSNFLQIKKFKEVDEGTTEARLFSRERVNGENERVEPTADEFSYDRETLKSAVSIVFTRDALAASAAEALEITEILIDDEKALVELKGGTVVGLNMDPDHPNTIEIRGYKRPKGIENAIINVLSGKEEFRVEDGIKEDYRKFVELLRSKGKSATIQVSKAVRLKERQEKGITK